jgi:hypothetical protein
MVIVMMSLSLFPVFHGRSEIQRFGGTLRQGIKNDLIPRSIPGGKKRQRIIKLLILFS